MEQNTNFQENIVIENRVCFNDVGFSRECRDRASPPNGQDDQSYQQKLMNFVQEMKRQKTVVAKQVCFDCKIIEQSTCLQIAMKVPGVLSRSHKKSEICCVFSKRQCVSD